MVKGLNTLDVRKSNRKNIILALHYYGALAKQQIAETLGLSLQTVSVIIKDLQEEGLVTVGGVSESTGGRRARLNILVPDAKFACGIGVTRNNIRVAVVNLCSQVIVTIKRRTAFINCEDYWKTVAGVRDDALLKADVAPEKLLGTGMSIPGFVNPVTEQVYFAPTLSMGAINLACSYEALGGPVPVINDAKSAGFAYMWSKKRETNASYLLINRGVGGAIIEGQSLASGRRSGEFGHLTIVKDGLPCACGQRGCLEAYCSSAMITERSGKELEEFFESLESGDGACGEIWAEYLDYLSVGINNLRMAFDGDVIIGGEMSRYIAKYVERLRELLAARNPFNDSGNYVKMSDYGEFDSAIGCAHMMIDRFLS